MTKGSSSRSTDSPSTSSHTSFLHSLSSSHSNHPKTFNIAVVGLSGTERERGAVGSGKSCLCNRFVRPFADDYYPEHISVLSQSDFSGHIVNSDHWLYWGEVSKITEEGTELHFSIIEQTEFIDDSTLQTFKSSKLEPYYKRCGALKLSSSQKLMYICKNQLGIEKEYEQRYLHDGKFNVDGFVCIFDVSHVSGRTLEQNIEQTSLILATLLKTKKPVVLATTKNDESNEIYIREVDRLINRKEFRGSIPLIETSSHENVNVDLAFVVCAQLADKAKGRAKIIPYFEAIKYRKDALEYASEAFQTLLNLSITDYRILWHTVCKSLALNAEFLAYVDLFGQEAAHIMFKRHVKKLKDDFIRRKSQMYLRLLPELLHELMPHLHEQLSRRENDQQVTSGLEDEADGASVPPDWERIKMSLRNHPDFNEYFVETPPHIPWYEIDLIASGETRIPWNVIDSGEGEVAFNSHTHALRDEDRRLSLKRQLKQHLTESAGFISPGKSLNEVRLLLLSNEQLMASLTEDDVQDVYDEYQREIIDIAKKHFLELLLEHAELFYHFASFGPGSVITQEDIYKISEILSHDIRYTALNRLEQDRMLMLLRHLAFVHGPVRENCPNFPDCVDRLIECILPSLVHMTNGNLAGLMDDTSASRMNALSSMGRGHDVSGSSTSSNRSPKNNSHSSSINNNVCSNNTGNQLNNNSRNSNNNHSSSGQHGTQQQSSVTSTISSTAYESMSSLNLIILASNNLGYELASLLKIINEKVTVNGIHYSLDVRIINSDDINEAYSEITCGGLFHAHGCICVYSNIDSLEYVTDAVEKVLLTNLELDAGDNVRCDGGQISSFLLSLPLTILFASQVPVSDPTYSLLLEEGQARAHSLQCPFFNVTGSLKSKSSGPDSSVGPSSGVSYCGDSVMQALISLIDSVQAKCVSGINNSGNTSLTAFNSNIQGIAGPSNICVNSSSQITNDFNVNCANSSSSLNLTSISACKTVNADLRILVLAMCGDPFKLDDLITPYLNDKSTVKTSNNSFAVDVFIPPSSSSNNPLPLDDSNNSNTSTGQSPGAMRSHLSSSPSPVTCRKVVEFIWTSYHNAQVFRDELLHGFILIYSAHRRASLSTLAAFSRNIPNTPTQMIAVTDGEPLSWLYSQNNQVDELIADGEILASKIHAHYVSISTDVFKLSYLIEFFNDALERKPQIEAAFDLDDSDDAASNVAGEDVARSINCSATPGASQNSQIHPTPRARARGSRINNCDPPPVPSRFESYEVTQSLLRQDTDGDYEELPSERNRFTNNGIASHPADDNDDEENVHFAYASADESDEGDIEDDDLDDYNRARLMHSKKKKCVNRSKINHHSTGDGASGGGGTSSDDILDETDDRLIRSRGHPRSNRYDEQPLNVHPHEQRQHHLISQRHSRNLDIDPYSTVPDDDDTDDGNSCHLNRLGEVNSDSRIRQQQHKQQERQLEMSPKHRAIAPPISDDHLIKPSRIKNRRSLHAELMNDLSIIDNNYHCNVGHLIDSTMLFDHHGYAGPSDLTCSSRVSESAIQPPPYSVAVSSLSYASSSSSASAAHAGSTSVAAASSPSRPVQVPLDIAQRSMYHANEFDNSSPSPFNINGCHRRTSMPVTSSAALVFAEPSDNNCSDDLFSESSAHRVNRPDVLGLRNIERQLSLPVKSPDVSCDYNQSRRSTRRNFTGNSVFSATGNINNSDTGDCENYSGDQSRANSSAAGGAIDDEDPDNECGDDELSEYGAYPPPEPAPPDFIPSNNSSAFLSPNQQTRPALPGHSSASSIEGWPDSSSFVEHSDSKKSQMFSNYLPQGTVGSFANSPAFSAIRSKYQEGGSRSSIRSNISVDTNAAETSSNNSTGTAIGVSGSSGNSCKPIGKLNLSQFDNITSALGKLTVTPHQVSSQNSRQDSLDDAIKGRLRSLARRREPLSLDKGSDSESDRSSPDTGHGSSTTATGTAVAAAVAVRNQLKSSGVACNSSGFGNRNSRSALATRDSSITSGISAGSDASALDLSSSTGPGSALNDASLILSGSSQSKSSLSNRINPQSSRRTAIAASIPVAPPKLPPLDPSLLASVTSSPGGINSIASAYSKLLNVLPESAGNDETGARGKEAARQLGLMLEKSALMSSSADGSACNIRSLLSNRSNYNLQGGFRSSLGATVAASSASANTSTAAIKKKLREEEKKKLKEEEKLAKRASKSSKKKNKSSPQLKDFVQSTNNLIPLFVEKCITFIEDEGLDSEGIYRVPGNRAHVDLLFHKFDEDANVSIKQLDIPVNAVATALKDFFSKRLPSIIPSSSMEELTEIANIRDRSNRLLALRQLLRKLPPINFALVKFVFAHFVRVSENSKLNSMDSKNLAICWWPTLLPLEFNDMLMFERMRPHLEESVQTMIDQFALLFDDETHEMVV